MGWNFGQPLFGRSFAISLAVRRCAKTFGGPATGPRSARRPGCAVGFEAILFQDTFGRGVMHQGRRLQPVQAQFVPGDAHSGADDTRRQRAPWALQSVLYPTWAFWKAPRTIELSVNRPTMISSPASSHRPLPGRARRCRPQRRVRPPAVVRGWRAGSPAARVA